MILLIIMGATVGYGDITPSAPNDGCDAWRAGANQCAINMGICLGEIALLCTASTFAYPACFFAGASVCAGVGILCGNSNDKMHPNCPGTGVFNNPFWDYVDIFNINYECVTTVSFE